MRLSGEHEILIIKCCVGAFGWQGKGERRTRLFFLPRALIPGSLVPFLARIRQARTRSHLSVGRWCSPRRRDTLSSWLVCDISSRIFAGRMLHDLEEAKGVG